MQQQNNRPAWLTNDFELRFQEAFGREMSAEEKIFFGLEALNVAGENSKDRKKAVETRPDEMEIPPDNLA
jgi:hypothetical protein